jgi:hypothetical protein
MAYMETVRPNADSSPLEWSIVGASATHHAAISQEPGGIGFISPVDTARINGWGDHIQSLSTGTAEDRHGWTDWQGPATAFIDVLTFRAAGYVGVFLGQDLTINVYIDSSLVGTGTLTFTNRIALDLYHITEVEIDLDGLFTPTQFNTMETSLVEVTGSTKVSIYALECDVQTSEKRQDGITPTQCKTIATEVCVDKTI